MRVTPRGERTHLAAVRGGRQRARRAPPWRRAATPASRPTARAASTLARLPRPTSGVSSRARPAGGRDVGGHAVDAARSTSRWRVTSAGALDREGDRAGRRTRAAPRHTRASSALATSSVGAARAPGSPPWRRRSRRRDAKCSRCASPTLVQTRTSGSAMPTSVRISPGALIPSSSTATSGGPPSRSQLEQRERQPDVVVEVARGSGTPGTAAPGTPPSPPSSSSCRPMPVMATTRAPAAPAHLARRPLQRAVVSSTATTTTGVARAPPSRAAPDGSRPRPPRPRATRLRHELVPVVPLAARSRRTAAPGGDRPRIDPERDRSGAPDAPSGARAATRRPRRRHLARRCRRRRRPAHSSLHPRRRRARRPRAPAPRLATSTSSNGSDRSPITWYFSCPLPAIEHDIAGPRLAHRPLDRRAAIDDGDTGVTGSAAAPGPGAPPGDRRAARCRA